MEGTYTITSDEANYSLEKYDLIKIINSTQQRISLKNGDCMIWESKNRGGSYFEIFNMGINILFSREDWISLIQSATKLVLPDVQNELCTKCEMFIPTNVHYSCKVNDGPIEILMQTPVGRKIISSFAFLISSLIFYKGMPANQEEELSPIILFDKYFEESFAQIRMSDLKFDADILNEMEINLEFLIDPALFVNFKFMLYKYIFDMVRREFEMMSEIHDGVQEETV